jgi:hypothetical protein
MIPQENRTGFLGNGEFPKIGVLKNGEPKTGMHNLDIRDIVFLLIDHFDNSIKKNTSTQIPNFDAF